VRALTLLLMEIVSAPARVETVGLGGRLIHGIRMPIILLLDRDKETP
jgi:hypothetical protein